MTRFKASFAALLTMSLWTAQPLQAREAHASDGKPKEAQRTTSTGKRIRSEDDESVTADSSEAMREGKRGSVTIPLLGFGEAGFLKGGIDGGIFLKPSLLIAARYESYSNVRGGSDSGYTYVTKVNAFTIYAKRFWANSFYTNLGLSQNTHNYRSKSGSETVEQRYSQQNLAIAIGNQWQWSYFTLGCDWFGTSYVIHQSVETNKKFNSTTNEALTPETIDKQTAIRFLVLYLGVSW